MQPLTITIAATRRALGLGTTKLYELINEGTLETIKIGRRRLITYASINRLVSANAVTPRCVRLGSDRQTGRSAV